MKPVDQTIFYDPSVGPKGQRGNCLQAVIASLLELPLEEVPHFVGDDLDHDGDNNLEWHWWKRLLDFLKSKGYQLYVIMDVKTRDGLEPDEYYLASGPSYRGQGIHHVVIYQGDKMVHDPHFSRQGVMEVTHIEVIRKIPSEQAEEIDSGEQAAAGS